MAETMVTSVNNNVLLPVRCRHRRLFLELFTLSAALSAASYLFKCLALATDHVSPSDLYLSLHDMNLRGVPDFIATWMENDHHRLLPLAYLVAGIAVGSVTYIATVSAAVLARRYDLEESEEVVEEMEEEEEEEEEQEHLSLPSFLGTAKGNIARPAKIVALGCGLKVALIPLLGNMVKGALDRSEVMYPALALLVCVLVEIVCEVAVVASVAEEPAGENAVGRACRVMRGKYKEFLLYVAGQWVIHDVFSLVCAIVAKVDLPLQVDAAVVCLLHGAKQLFSVANVTGYYFACRKKEKQKQTRACHLD